MSEAVHTPITIPGDDEPRLGESWIRNRWARAGVLLVIAGAFLQAREAIAWAGLFVAEWLVQGGSSMSRMGDHAAFVDDHLGDLVSFSTVAELALILPWMLFAPRLLGLEWRTFFGLERVDAWRCSAWALAAVLMNVLYTTIEPHLPETSPSALDPTHLLNTSSQPLLFFVAIAIIVPVLEEVWIRGWIQGGLRSLGFGHAASISITLLPWIWIHLHLGVFDLLAVTAMGLLAGIARARTGALLPAIAVHAGWNATVFVATLIEVQAR